MAYDATQSDHVNQIPEGLRMAFGPSYWSRRFARWPARLPSRPGYTVLVPVPGDLPVFLELALAVCRLQRHDNRVATLVIPDVRTPETDEIVARHRPSWPGPLELISLPRPERWVLPRMRNPGRNHGVQLIAGISACTSSHVVLHDADLFLLDDRAHEQQYAHAASAGLSVLGVSPSWDPWYAQHGLELAATWEMLACVGWLRGHPPHRLIGHDAVRFGELHTFDTTFWAQTHTDPAKIEVRPLGDDLIHFNYVISTYRAYQRTAGPFHDDSFKLLLVRVLIDLFDTTGVQYAVPSLQALAQGLGDPSAPVYYEEADLDVYTSFRAQLDGIVAGPWAASRRAQVTPALRAFDDWFARRRYAAAG